MNKTPDRAVAHDAAHLAAVVAYLKTYAKQIGVEIKLPSNPRLSELQRAARACELSAEAVMLPPVVLTMPVEVKRSASQ